MNAIKTELPGVVILEPQVFGDARGWFMESWSQKKMEDIGISVDFVQDNHSFSAEKGTLRGLHYQLNPMAQAKMGWCGTIGRELSSAFYSAWICTWLYYAYR